MGRWQLPRTALSVEEGEPSLWISERAPTEARLAVQSLHREPRRAKHAWHGQSQQPGLGHCWNLAALHTPRLPKADGEKEEESLRCLQLPLGCGCCTPPA